LENWLWFLFRELKRRTGASHGLGRAVALASRFAFGNHCLVQTPHGAGGEPRGMMRGGRDKPLPAALPRKLHAFVPPQRLFDRQFRRKIAFVLPKKGQSGAKQ